MDAGTVEQLAQLIHGKMLGYVYALLFHPHADM